MERHTLLELEDQNTSHNPGLISLLQHSSRYPDKLGTQQQSGSMQFMRILLVPGGIFGGKMANASKGRNIGGTTSLPLLWHRMYKFVKPAITELSEVTIVRSWEITGILRVVYSAAAMIAMSLMLKNLSYFL